MNRRGFLIGAGLTGLSGCAAKFAPSGFGQYPVSVPDLAPYGTLLTYYAPYAGDFTVANQQVATWRDRSGNANNLTEATNRPAFLAHKFRKSVALDFDGTNDTLAAGTAFAGTQFSIFAVVNVHTVPGSESDILSTRIASNKGWSLGFNSSSQTVARNFNSVGTNSATATCGCTFQTDKWFLIEAHYGASSYFATENGLEGSTRSDTIDASTTALTIATAIGSSGATPFDGMIGLIAIFSGQLSSTNRAKVRNVLNQRYRIY